MYLCGQDRSSPVIIAVYVEDTLIAAKSDARIAEVKLQLPINLRPLTWVNYMYMYITSWE